MSATQVPRTGMFATVRNRRSVVSAISDGRVRIALSTPLLFEYEDVLKRNHAVLNLSDAEVEVVLDNLCRLADFQAVYFLWRPCLPDAKDDMVLELAVAAQVPRIVSFNAKDFSPASRFGIEVVTPKIMLEELQ